jgi:hypothetical protein
MAIGVRLSHPLTLIILHRRVSMRPLASPRNDEGICGKCYIGW